MEDLYSYWEICFISCEGNNRWTIARAPFDWDEYQIRDSVSIGGCGDDVANITSITETNSDDYGLDFS
mgnify:CR=1 FL=1